MADVTGGADARPPAEEGSQGRIDGLSASLWRITYAFWTLPGAEQTCLGWQARFGLDVSLFCWASWAAAVPAIGLFEPDVDAAAAVTADWRHSVIDPVRSARKSLRSAAPAPDTAPVREAYRTLRAAELAAERAEQRMLVEWLYSRPQPGGGSLGIGEAMGAVVRVNGGSLDAADRERLEDMARQFGRLARE